MKAEIVVKQNGARRQVEDTQHIALDRPSVILLKLAPENVARYERRGDDLVLVLKDGREIAIHGFFIKYPEGDAGHAPADSADAAAHSPAAEESRNDLVLRGIHTGQAADDNIVLTAYLLVDRRAPDRLERLVAELSLQPGVYTVHWHSNDQQTPVPLARSAE